MRSAVKKIVLGSFIMVGVTVLGVATVPASNLWQVTYGLCSLVDTTNSLTDASLFSIYDTVTNIDAAIDNLTFSSLDGIVSSVELIISDLDIANSIVDLVVSDLERISTQLESLTDALTVLENLDALIVEGTCSCVDRFTASSTDVLKNKIYITTTAVDTCCATLSFLEMFMLSDIDSVSSKTDSLSNFINDCCKNISFVDVLIKSDIDSVSTKVDSVFSQSAVIKSELDSCCSVVDVIYKCLVGVAITQAMIPFTITSPGNYYVCEPLTTGAAAPIITIAANDVSLDLNDFFITSTADRGIYSSGYNNIYIKNGNITSKNEAIYIQTAYLVRLENVNIMNAASNAVYLSTITELFINNCIVVGFNSTVLANNAGFFLYNSGPASISNTIVSTVSNAGYSGFYISRAVNATVVELVNCIASQLGYGFYVNQDANAKSNIVFRNCYAASNAIYGFNAVSTTSSFNGPTYENCVARMNAITNNGVGFVNNNFTDTVYTGCVSTQNAHGFLSLQGTDTIYEKCLSNNNSIQGFWLENNAGVGNSRVVFDYCVANNNGSNGFLIESLSSLTRINRSVAANNASSGINNASATTYIVDTRSQHSATTVNGAYNLNGVADVIGGATQVIIS